MIRDALRSIGNIAWYCAATLLLEGYARLAMWRTR